MRRHAFLGFLGVLCAVALIYMMQFSTALFRREQGPDTGTLKRKELDLLDLQTRLRKWEAELDLRHKALHNKEQQEGKPSHVALETRSGQSKQNSAGPLHVETAIGPDGKPIVEADNFADLAAKPLIEAVVDEPLPPATAGTTLKFPKRQENLPKWADKLPLYDPMPKCLSGPPPSHKTRLTRRFHIDIPGPELAKLRKALCVVRYNKAIAFNEAINLFSFRYLPYLLIVDLYGNILASHTMDYLTTLVAPKWVNSTTISAIQKRYGEAPASWVARTVPFLWNVETGRTVEVHFKPPGFLHHDIDYSPISQTFLTLHRYVNKKKNSPGYNVLFDDIFEVNMEGKAIWHFNGSYHIPYIEGQWTAAGKHPDSDCVDFRVRWCRDHMHGNTVFWDQEENVIYYNAKHTDSFWKLDKANTKIVWAVGRYGNMTLYDKNGHRVEKLFKKSHGIEKIGDNHFLVFDNVYKDVNNNNIPGSRWLEMEVDPVKKVAREKRFWVAPPPRYAHQMGDADRMPNGNTLMSITSTDLLTEASMDGKIAWEMSLPAPPHGKGGKWWIYHAERFMLTPLIKMESGEENVLIRQGDATLRLLLWNTVRVRYRAKGTVQVWRSAEVIATAAFTFEINWITTKLKVDIPVDRLECGLNVLTIKCTNADDITGELPVNARYLC